jgi:excinuclease Cho
MVFKSTRVHFAMRRHPEFDVPAGYAYPHHLREAIGALPAAPGVYIFHGEQAGMPLYIGKSVNLRGRVLCHLRNSDEARMLRQIQRISHMRTAGEIGALLLEARLIKQMQPLMNQKLRRSRQLCSLQLTAGRLNIVYSRDVNFASAAELFGLFSSQRAAQQALRDLADRHSLCYGALGLETLRSGRPCFRAMLRQCAGVCCGAESSQEHEERLRGALQAMRVVCWPFGGAVGLVEEWEGERQIHVVHNWTFLGSVCDVEQARALGTMAPGFDADGYKILCKPIFSGNAQLLKL